MAEVRYTYDVRFIDNKDTFFFLGNFKSLDKAFKEVKRKRRKFFQFGIPQFLETSDNPPHYACKEKYGTFYINPVETLILEDNKSIDILPAF